MDEQRVIIIKDFFDVNKHLYSDQLGWQRPEKQSAHSLVSKEIFESLVCQCLLNLAFYYVDNDTYYGIHSEAVPIEVKILPRDRSASPFINSQCRCNTHDEGVILYRFDDPMDMWDNIIIDGKTLEEVLERSLLCGLS